MVKEIKYTGLTASPSDYECPDGDLAAVLNVVPEEGSFSPVLPPRQLFTLTDGGQVRFVHKTSYIKNYIILFPNNSIKWRTEEDPDEYSHGELNHNFSGRTIHQINAIGNTLLILADDGMHYFLWKGYRNGTESENSEPTEYLYLGTHIPELSLSFGLQAKKDNLYTNENQAIISRETWPDYDLNKLRTASEEYPIKRREFQAYRDGSLNEADGWEVQLADFSNTILSMVNRLIAKANSEGRYVYPFLVRYAYRLYDGSLIMHSAPLLMITATNAAPYVYFGSCGNVGSDRLRITGVHAECLSFDLDYSVEDIAQLNELKKWKDIVKSVDIFSSRQFYTYDQSGTVKALYYFGNKETLAYTDSYSYCKSSLNIDSIKDKYFKHSNHMLLRNINDIMATNRGDVGCIELPLRSKEIVNNEIKSCSQFYLLQSFGLDELKTERTKIFVSNKITGITSEAELEANKDVRNIETREIMTDDYESHDLLLPEYSYVYNGRLNLANLSKRLFGGFSACSSFMFTNAYVLYKLVHNAILNMDFYEPDLTYDGKEYVNVYYYIKQDNKDIVVRGKGSFFGVNSDYLYLYYPNLRAYKAVVVINNYFTNYYEITLTPHEKLNGSVFFESLNFELKDGNHDYLRTPVATTDDYNTIELKNKVYTSEINNPYYFPVSNITTIGTGKVLAVSSAAKALSQGQFGQFPLYAFTNEGVWALEISKTGSISAVQPITRDVCINSDSITQLDSSVLFATDRGIMLLSGSNSICISDDLNYTQTFQITSLPQSEKLLAFEGFTQSDLSYAPFLVFVQGCRMLYSYNLQRIIVFNRDYPYAYVYSLKSKSWGMMPSVIVHAITSYPEAIAQLADGSIVDYSAVADQTAEVVRSVLITRPFKLDLPDQLKTIDCVVQRGNFQRGHVKTALYGSRDLQNWFVVWTSVDHYLRGFRGSPYKYYRLVLLCDLDPAESIYGCTIQYSPRFTNRLR